MPENTTKSRIPLKDWNTKLALGNDKLYHMLMGILIVLVGATVGLPLGVIALLLFAGAFGKEFLDSLGYGNPDWWDLVFTLICGIPLLIILYVIQRQRRKNGDKNA